jgi:hypothetical protein
LNKQKSEDRAAYLSLLQAEQEMKEMKDKNYKEKLKNYK